MEIQADMFDINTLVETNDVEMKKAGGRDGKGAIPDSVWATYSAMANTIGGVIILGAEQIGEHEFRPYHLDNAEKMVQDFWNTVNDCRKISKNILHESNVKTVLLPRGERIVVITVPQANRKDKPIFINNQIFGGTYKRYNEGDYRCPDDIVKQMLAEQISETMDDVIISGYGFNDIDLPTFNAYRQRLSNIKPDHPFLAMPPDELLRQIGGFRIDRNSGQSGLTLAGLLMFGKLRDILDNVPNYVVDYQERPRAVTELRWVDRVTTDFTWSGNLFSFYQIVIRKLFADLKVPFKLENATTRIEDTPVHKAIREAFVNTLIHADFRGKCSILVVKRPDLFGFRNPGIFRIPKAEVIRGGSSDCRNRTLQKMFQLIGLAEQAGSGVPKIFNGWDSQDWKRPEYEERVETNQTILALRMSSLLPEETVKAVQNAIGIGKYRSLSKLGRLAIVTAYAEGCVNHERMMDLSKEHGADITQTLRQLNQKGLLSTQGHGKATIYFPSGHPPVSDDLHYCLPVLNNRTEPLFNNVTSSPHSSPSNSPHSEDTSSPHSEDTSSPHSVPLSSPHSGALSPSNAKLKNIPSYGKVVHPFPREEIINDRELLLIAQEARNKKRLAPHLMDEMIISLCRGRFLSMTEISILLGREEKTISNNYLTRLCRNGLLIHKYPMANDPRQQYTSKDCDKG